MIKNNNFKFVLAILLCLTGRYDAPAAGPASSRINLSAPTALSRATDATSRTTLALASGDFDEDGVADLVTSYAAKEGGQISVRRGNVDAIYPNSEQARAHKNQNQSSHAPFLSEGQTIALPEAIDAIGAGDFDADGHWDIVGARIGGDKLYWLRGDGRGNFAEAKTIDLHGTVTALTTGEMNRVDGLTDVAVGIISAAGAQVLIFESPDGAMRGEPEKFALPAAAAALAFGQLDANGMSALAIASGNEVMIVHGRDRKLSLDPARRADVKPAQVSHHELGSPVQAIALGHFAGHAEADVAALTADGVARVVDLTITKQPISAAQTSKAQAAASLQLPNPMTLRVAGAISSATASSMRLIAAKVSSLPSDELIVFGGSSNLQIISTRDGDVLDASGKLVRSGSPRLSVAASVPSDGEVTALLPMRLNASALKDLVLLKKNGAAPSIVQTQTAATYVVNAEGVTNDAAPGDGVCADTNGNCTFNAALQEANAHPGADTIQFNIPGGGVHTLTHDFGRYATEAVTIDGTTQPDGRIEIAANGDYPVIFYGGNSVLRGVATYGNSYAVILPTSGNIIEGNYIGFRADGTKPSAYGSYGSGISFQGGVNGSQHGGNNLIGGTTTQARNVISNCYAALDLSGGTNGNVIQGNYIGTNVAGTSALPNNLGIRTSVYDAMIGGTTAGAGNLISGNGGANPAIDARGGAIIQGNRIGTTADGTQPLANGSYGIQVGGDGTKTITIGGTTTAARNVIAASAVGISVDTTAQIQGNFIGTNAAGTGALPNAGSGIDLNGGNSVVGGIASGAGNLISGNGDNGVRIGGYYAYQGDNNVVQGNLIGTDITGTVAIPNHSNGVEVDYSTGGHLIGGSSAGARNVISGNSKNGISFKSSNTANRDRAEGNYIGVNRFGTGALPNGQNGVLLDGSGSVVGGTAPGAENVIAFNGGAGIASTSGRIAGVILPNSIFSNTGLGIDRGSDGVTRFNSDYDEFPTLTSVVTSGSSTTISGKLRTYTDGQTSVTIEFFSSSSLDPSGYGEGKTFVGQTVVTQPGYATETSFSATITPAVPPGHFVTAVAIGPTGTNYPNEIGSSEFAFSLRVAGDATAENTPLVLHVATPSTGGDTGAVSATIVGEGIQPGATVLLRRAGQSDIVGQNLVFSDDHSSVRALFDLNGHALGTWDVVVTNPGGATFTIPVGFAIEAGRAAQVWMHLLGRDVIRFSSAARFSIVYGNSSNTDAYMVPLWVAGIPKNAGVKVEFAVDPVPVPQVPGASDPNQLPLVIKTDTEQMLPLLIPVIPAGGVRALQFTITVPNAAPNFTLRSWVAPALLSSIQSSNGPRSLAASDGSPGAGDPLTKENGIACAKLFLQATFDCITNFFPLGPCAKSLISYASNTAQLNNGSNNPLGWSQFGAGALQLALNCAGKTVPGIGQLLSAVSCGASIYSAYNSCWDTLENKPVRPVGARDPNDKTGSPGSGPEHFVTGKAKMPYSIYFENQATATAPAQQVIITDQLDVAKLNLDTFELGAVSFGPNTIVSPPPGLSEWTTDVDLRPQQNLIVRVVAALDRTSGVVSWHFFSLNPATMQPTEDPLAGFLPPNVNAPEGDGAVTFSIDPYPSQPFGTQISNHARITFDSNAPIDTPVWINTIDDSLPSSSVSALAALQNSRRFQVSWTGSDTGSGVLGYTIYVSENGGPYTIWMAHTPATSAIYDGRPNSTYAFYSIAEDGAGNLETPPSSADTSTATPGSPPVQLTAASSRKFHGSAGPFDIDLPLSGNPGIECRSGGANGDYILVFTFANPLTRVDGASVSGTGVFNGGEIGPDPHQYFVTLTGVASGQYLHVSVHGAGDATGNFSDSSQVVMGVLVGDVNGDGFVLSGDYTAVRQKSGAPVNSNTFRYDINADGFILSGDYTTVRKLSGNHL